MVHRVPTGRIGALWMALGMVGLVFPPPAARAQTSPEESARRMKPAPGLEATLWAAEPMLINPTNIDVDSRGRVWVAEGLNYRLSRSGNRRFHRIEEADRIKILEDTDGDGKADKVTVFADRIFPVPMGIAVEERYGKDGKYQGCRVFVGNSPDLLVLEDTNGDDKADKRYPLLTGFGGVDSDHGVHGMALGLDGKLYFTHGDGCCSVQHDHSERPQNFDVIDKGGRHVWTDQLANTLRVNRDGTQFEIICDRQRNNYETCLNSFGNIFTSDNDDDGNRGCRVIWAMDGGHYGYKTPGSPRHWGEEVPGNVPKIVGTGNGSPCGIMVYEGELLPAEYRGAVLEVDAGTRQVNFFPITRKGASFRTESKVFLAGDDPWFRPVDACTAPDGSVFVADWYDAGVGGHAFSDQTTGRLYRVAPKGHRSRKPRPDFTTVDGLIAALKSPNLATQDVARRLLIERGEDPNVAAGAVGELAVHGKDPIYRARALWVWHAIAGDPVAMVMLMEGVNQGDPRLREQAVRILGRDCRENGRVVSSKAEAEQPPAALKHLDILTAMADDPDAGVRRELILAFRNIATDTVGDALRRLAASWDGRDRWYLEALGLALEKRASDFLSKLFDGSLYGELELERSGRDGKVALPPYFPVDRNEAFLPADSPDLPATALSKYLGLAWRLHCREALPLLERIIPYLRTPELQQAGDDVLERMTEPETAELVAGLATRADDPARRLGLTAMLARRLADDWSAARDRPPVVQLIERSLGDREARAQGIALAAATGAERYRATIEKLAEDSTLPEDVRVAAVEAVGSFRGGAAPILDRLLATVRGKPSSNPAAEAAVRALGRSADAPQRLAELLTARDYPLGVRREAVRTMARLKGGGPRVLELARAGKLPDDLKIEATTVLYASPERRVREAAAQVLPLPKMAGGHSLPPIGELIRREGDPQRGRAVFFRAGTNSCGGCHRVQGRGQWVGPDLSTIGVKSGRDELIRSILNPSAAIGSNFRSLVLALDDGRVLTGLPVEESTDRLVLKTAAGERITIRTSSIEDRRTSDVSLMPEGLAQTMTDQELVDLLAYLTTLRQPVSIAGQYQVIGPLEESRGAARIDPAIPVDLQASRDDGRGRKLSWRRMNADTEGLVDLGTLGTIESRRATVVYAYTPVVSPVDQKARLVLDTPAEVAVWIEGKPVPLAAGDPARGEPRTATVDLPQGSAALLVRLALDGRSGARAHLVTTVVADQPVAFSH
ncbi:MAG TPA: PVC-type heme-binding CxxCH protein [Isosphaeraceae bacterium]|nr:PVC-type heme-binding CxxCH protein [Isosphaeraceae bacterium]